MEARVKKGAQGKSTVVYISGDGKEFDNTQSCFNHEMCAAYKAISKSDDVKENKDADGMLPFDGEDHSWECDYRWYMPLNSFGVELLNKVFWFSGDKVTESEIGKWVCVCVGSSDAWFVGTLDNSIEYASDMCKRFGLRTLGVAQMVVEVEMKIGLSRSKTYRIGITEGCQKVYQFLVNKGIDDKEAIEADAWCDNLFIGGGGNAFENERFTIKVEEDE